MVTLLKKFTPRAIMRALVYTQLFHSGPDRRKHNKLITQTKVGRIFLLGLSYLIKGLIAARTSKKQKVLFKIKSILLVHHAVLIAPRRDFPQRRNPEEAP